MKTNELTTEQKLRLICGKDFWHTCDFDGAIASVRVTDASMGVRMPDESEHGSGDKPSVAYPSMQMLANTWNTEMARTYAECVADDCLDYGADVLLGPGVNIKRSPLCGRNFEYLSEDPYLAGVMAREYVAAMQAEGVGACLKHFCCNNLEYNRLQQSSEVDERTLREIYYKPFEIACEAKPVSVMSSYNRINGVYGSEYKKGYNVLRNEYGFDGLIMSDWDAVRDRAKAAQAGLDLEMPYHAEHYEQLVADYKSGKITEEEIDECARRVLELVARCKKMQSGKKRKHTLSERIAFTQTAEQEGIVLLKNNGILPLKKGQSLSMCGWFARPCAYDRKRPELVCGGGSGRVTRLTPMFDMLEIMNAEHGGNITYEPAFADEGTDSAFMNSGKATDNAAVSAVNIVFAGTGAFKESEGGDRAVMELDAAQTRTILDTARVNPNTVVVLFAGAPVDMSEWIGEVAAVVYAGFPGEQGGQAIANVLTGKVNPSGKLSETFPVRYEDAPAAKSRTDGKVTRYDERLLVGYRYYDTLGIPPLFAFGHGLSYSEFEYGGMDIKTDGAALDIAFDIANTSAVDGKETAQVYIRALSSYVDRPYKELKGFAKTAIKAGETARVKLRLDKRAFEYWSVANDGWAVEDGAYEILVAASATDIRLNAKIIINGSQFVIVDSGMKSR